MAKKRAMIEDATSVGALLKVDNVELGGHGWDSFRPRWRYRAVNKVLGSPHGSSAMQERMVGRTCSTIRRVTGQDVLSWRNHAYSFDRHTARVLAEGGIRVWSDEVDAGRVGPRRDSKGITILPINTTPDHEHVYHGGQTIETVPVARRAEYDHPDAWGAGILRQVDSILGQGGVATILAHPLCMKVADDWRTFERLCSSLSGYPNIWARDAAEMVLRDR